MLAVDQLLIRTTTAPANLSSPLALLLSFATTAIFDQSSTEEEQQRNPSLIAEPIFAAPSAKPQRAQSSVAPLATKATPADHLPAATATQTSLTKSLATGD